jgi:hypothetical protein
MIYLFSFGDQVGKETTVNFTAPNEYEVTAYGDGIVCILRSTTVRRSLFRRALGFFH